MKKSILLIAATLFVSAAGLPRIQNQDSRLQNASRHPAENGWIFVHLQGSPRQVGFQHGYLLSPEIEDAYAVIKLELGHDKNKDWQFFRDAAKNTLWPHVEPEYQDELQGIVEGLNAKGARMDIWDVVAMNAFLEFYSYVDWFKKQNEPTRAEKSAVAAEHCSAFVATGSYTKDGKVVIAHNNWSSYLDGQRWNIIFDIVPEKGYRILMDGFPGLIHSADDFGMNSAGILITETTITGFFGWDSDGIPEFVRARKAMQYSASVDDFDRILRTGNNGGYANNWLVADRKNNEIASLELGLKNVTLLRSKDGYFCGANFPVNEKLIREETHFDPHDPGLSANSRRVRWEELMAEYKGKIDVAAGQKFLADHWDTLEKKEAPSERTLCGHVDLSPRGMKGWQEPYGIAGTVQAKVADAAMAEQMSFLAAMGHPCGVDFKAAAHLRLHPQFNWQKGHLQDLDSRLWTLFTVAK
jgi:Phospholipase B